METSPTGRDQGHINFITVCEEVFQILVASRTGGMTIERMKEDKFQPTVEEEEESFFSSSRGLDVEGALFDDGEDQQMAVPKLSSSTAAPKVTYSA